MHLGAVKAKVSVVVILTDVRKHREKIARKTIAVVKNTTFVHRKIPVRFHVGVIIHMTSQLFSQHGQSM